MATFQLNHLTSNDPSMHVPLQGDWCVYVFAVAGIGICHRISQDAANKRIARIFCMCAGMEEFKQNSHIYLLLQAF